MAALNIDMTSDKNWFQTNAVYSVHKP